MTKQASAFQNKCRSNKIGNIEKGQRPTSSIYHIQIECQTMLSDNHT
jgi:hypothetical protein